MNQNHYESFLHFKFLPFNSFFLYFLYSYDTIKVMKRNRRKEEGEKYLERCVEAIKDIPLDINKKKDIAFKAEILSGIVYKREVIEKVFSEVIRM